MKSYFANVIFVADRKNLENKSITEDSMNGVLHSENVVMKDKSYVNGVNHDPILCIGYKKKKGNFPKLQSLTVNVLRMDNLWVF